MLQGRHEEWKSEEKEQHILNEHRERDKKRL